MPLTLPILKESGYRADDKLFFKERLLDSSAAPVVAYGKDEDNRIAYEMAVDEADLTIRLPLKKKEALDNLRAIDPKVEIKTTEGAQIAIVGWEEYACEKILDTDFMNKLAEKIGASQLMVGIPYKANMIATDANGPLKFKFPAIIQMYFKNPKADPISPFVFIVQKGEILAMGGENIQDEHTGNFQVTEQNNGIIDIELKATSPGPLFEEINEALDQSVSLLIGRKQKHGQFNYHLPADLKLTSKLVVDFENYVSSVNKEAGNRISTIFLQGQVQIAPVKILDGQVVETIPFGQLTEQELYGEFYTLSSLPNVHNNAAAVALMAMMISEFKSRGLTIPDPNAKAETVDKKWWQFWK